jgi:Ni,Fe-hydrogenase III small subunit/ferredoxin
MWVLRGLRNGVLTTRWPRRPDAYADANRGPVVLIPGPAEDAMAGQDAAALCPSGAIGTDPRGRVRVDQGSCILCGRCIAGRPDVFAWSAGPHGAALTRGGLVVPEVETPDGLRAVQDQLLARTRALRRSVHLRHVDAGSDGSEEWEIMALLNPVYDIHRLGLFFTASPRHADILLVTGAGSRGMAGPLRETYQGMPDPKAVIAVGTDAVSGGLISPGYATAGGIGQVVPVDVWLPGSPPTPFAILAAVLTAVGRLAARPGPAATGRGGPGELR